MVDDHRGSFIFILIRDRDGDDDARHEAGDIGHICIARRGVNLLIVENKLL